MSVYLFTRSSSGPTGATARADSSPKAPTPSSTCIVRRRRMVEQEELLAPLLPSPRPRCDTTLNQLLLEISGSNFPIKRPFPLTRCRWLYSPCSSSVLHPGWDSRADRRQLKHSLRLRRLSGRQGAAEDSRGVEARVDGGVSTANIGARMQPLYKALPPRHKEFSIVSPWAGKLRKMVCEGVRQGLHANLRFFETAQAAGTGVSP